MREPDRAFDAFEELRSGVARHLRRPAVEAIYRLSHRRRRRRMRTVAAVLAAVMVATAWAASIQRPEPSITPLPTPSTQPSEQATASAEPTATPSHASAEPQSPSETCSTRANVRPSGPAQDFSTYRVYLVNVLCLGVQVRVVWATYAVTDNGKPTEVQTLYRQGAVYLDRDHTAVTFALGRPVGCWRGYVGYGNVTPPAVINGPGPPGNDLGNLGAMMNNC
jgi:hypothetical protein